MLGFKPENGFLKGINKMGEGIGKGFARMGNFFGKHPYISTMVIGLGALGYVASKERHKVEEREQNYYGNAIQQVNAQQYAAAAAMQAAGPGSQINCSGASLEGLLAEQQQRAMG